MTTPAPAQTATPDLRAGIAITTLGGLTVLCDGKPMALPPSKKTRALLGFLAVVDRPQRRERLCEMFWDVPDDPRGALRWSLSRLRQIVGDAIEADRETVSLRADAVHTDYRRVRAMVSSDLRDIDPVELEKTAAQFRGRFLEDLALPQCPDFEAWRVAIDNEAELTHLRLRRTLIDRLSKTEPARALLHARALSTLHPDDPAMAVEIEALLEKSRRSMMQPAAPAGRAATAMPALPPHRPQDIHYCRTGDGVHIAYAIAGSGYPLLKCANWMSHLQYEWESPIWRHWMDALSARNTLVRYDQRGNGLSDWTVDDVSFEAMVADLECVADAARLDRFALLGVSRGAAVSAAYAARHPQRLSHLILYGGRAKGWHTQGDPAEIERRAAMMTLIRSGWGQDNPAFRRMFSSLFMPDATPEQMDWFSELQRRTISPENAARYQETAGNIDVTAALVRITTPTLVLHATGDMVVPFDTGRAFAAEIPGARFVPLDSDNHILLAHEPAFARCIEEIARFLPAPPG